VVHVLEQYVAVVVVVSNGIQDAWYEVLLGEISLEEYAVELLHA
jgi:hypothetical protein